MKTHEEERDHLDFGRAGEEAASAYLKNQGYRILQKNLRASGGEIDILARDGEYLCFVEVRTKHAPTHEFNLQSVDHKKQRQLSKVAVSFLKKNKYLGGKCRFDVVSVIYPGGGDLKIRLLKNAFNISGAWFF